MMASRVLATLLVLATAIVVCGSLGLRVNLTASLPLGIYRVISGPPSRGSIVQVCLPREVAEFARTRGYLGPGSCPGDARPTGKLVLAVAGDVVTVSRDEIRLNGAAVPNSRIASEDSRGRPLPHHAWGEHQLRRNELWLFSPYHRSGYDSRYFGPVLSADVITVLLPLWTTARRSRRVTTEPRPSGTSGDVHSRPVSGTTAKRTKRHAHGD